VIGSVITLVAAGCSSTHHVADPFSHGVTGGRVVADYVICDPTPSTCNRYVVIAPDTAAGTALRARTVATLTQRLRLRASAEPAVPATEGQPFDGTSAQTGAFVNTAEAELRLDAGVLDQGASAATGRLVLAALRGHPDAVVVRVVDTSGGARS